MHLSVTCPRCQSKYQLDPSMRGKKMRCPNSICRAVFEVRDDGDPAPAPDISPEARYSEPLGSEGHAALAPELVKKESPAPAPDRSPEARYPEPPGSGIAPLAPVPEKKPSAAPPPEPSADFPDDFPSDNDVATEAPPGVQAVAWQPESAAEPSVIAAPPAPRRRSWRPALIIIVMLLLVGIGIGVAYQQYRSRTALNETERFQKAETLYKDREYAEASAAFQKMERDFADSPHHPKYRFLAELSDVRQAAIARESPQETVKALERILQFATVYKGDPLLNKAYSGDVWETLAFLARELTGLAQQEKAPGHLALARRAWSESKAFAAPANANPAERERELQTEWKRVDGLLANHFERLQIIDIIKRNIERASAAGVKEALTLIEKTKRQDDSQIRTLMEELYAAHRKRVQFVPSEAIESVSLPSDDSLASLFVVPSLKVERAAKVSGSPILCLARGILYALEPTKGELVWARRVGIDARNLPLRVPADAITPEMVLVISTDQRSLSGVIARTGETIWQAPLSGVCLGKPIYHDHRVLVPTLNGRIDEIEIAEGRLLGTYDVGHALPLGGVHQLGANLAYFPADDFCMYAIDTKERTCANVLYTRHAAGSLPGLPGFVADDKAAWLLWSEMQGSDQTVLKPYALPIRTHDQKPVEPTLRLSGLSTAPWQGADRIAIATQTGMLSIYGIRQKGTRDPLLFPHAPGDFAVDLQKHASRCKVVHADAENYWVLAHGRLHCIQSAFDAAKGPVLHARWSAPASVGTAMHETQVRLEPDGRPILYMTTLASDHPTCMASAIDGETGKILWQRQLGIVPDSVPQVVEGFVVLGGGEGVMAFSADAGKSDKNTRSAGSWLLQEPWSKRQRYLLASASEVVALSVSDEEKGHVAIAKVSMDGKPRLVTAKLPAALQGAPTLGAWFLFLPLRNGILVVMSLKDGALVNGPDWRATGAEEEARGHVLFLNAGEILVTDGSRGLQRFASPDGKSWEKRAATQLAHRVLAPPRLLEGANGAKAWLVVLDASDTLTLMDADRLSSARRWTLPGKVTAGPFVRSGKIGCVVAGNRLVWIDPEQSEPAWEYAFLADVVGEPNVVDGALIVADIAGQFLALDLASGRALGAPLTLKANVAPAAAPLPFGNSQALAPLTDGSMVVVPMQKLRDPPSDKR